MVYVNKLYHINYLSGCSGTFLQDILIQFANKECNQSVSYLNRINAHGSKLVLHYNSSFVLESVNPTGFLCYNLHDPDTSFVDQIKVLNNNPIVTADHHIPEWDKIFQKFPNAKNIIVQVDARSLLRIEFNIFYKIYLDHYKQYPSDPAISLFWTKLVTQNSNLKNYSMDNFSFDELLIAIKKYIKIKPKLHPIANIYSTEYNIPKEYSDRVIAINYYDIINNKDYVLETISVFIDEPIKPCIIESYDSYLEQQHNLFPWLKDSDTY
jgi:hypothetical protein